MAFERVASASELWDGDMIACRVAGRRVVLLRVGEDVRAYEDRCPHRGVALSEGVLEGRSLTCHAHGWQYDAVTGHGINPRSSCLSRFAARVEADDVLVDVGEVVA